MSVADGTGQINFVGRGSQLRELLSRVDDAAARRPSTVLLGGEAGVGKSRLIRRVRRRGHGPGPRYARAVRRVRQPRRGRRALRAADRRAARLVRERGADHLNRYGGPAFGGELNKLIADFTGTGQPAASTAEPNSQTRVFGAVLRMLDHLGANAPTVLIFEDLHWADPSTVDLVSYLGAVADRRTGAAAVQLPLGGAGDRAAVTLMAEPSFRRRIHADRAAHVHAGRAGAVPGCAGGYPEFLKRCF